MTQFYSPKTPEFDRLRAFLKENAPQAPDATPDLEMQLIKAIDTLPQEEPIAPTQSWKRWWILSAAIVTSVGLLWGGGRTWQMAQRLRPLPSDGTLADVIPTGETSSGGTASDGTLADGTSSDGTSSDGTPNDGTPTGAELLTLQDFLEDTWGVVGYVDTTETWSNFPS